MEEKGFLAHVQEMGTLLTSRLKALATHYPHVFCDVRGAGLMLGLKVTDGLVNADLVKQLFDHGLLCVGAGENVIRLLPPLILNEDHIHEALDALEKVATQQDISA
jgi:acetylornithine/N-succinyldiaminopimelate aminotransferase